MSILPENILLVDKPEGITSFDVIRMLRRKMKIWKMGHAGTLDPFASGLMIIGVEKGTKLMNTFLKLSKVYEATILLGQKTDTGDRDGKIIEQEQPPKPSKEKIKEVLDSMVGTLELPVPIYSAVKRKGKPLYDYARKGEVVETPVKSMTVISYEFLDQKENEISIKWNVASGTYIRSLALEFAKRLGTIGTVIKLRRFSIDTYSVQDAIKIE
jgi:tRNA pseudouridine55 synthase